MSDVQGKQIVADVCIENGKLPEGWAEPTVKEVIEIHYGKGLKKSARSGGQVPVYGSNGVVGHHDVAFTEGPTIVIGRKGTVGAVNFSPVPCWPIDTTYFIDDFHELDPTYLVHALTSLGLEELDTSTAIPGLNRDDAYAQRFPLPPLAEQKRIVAQVEALLGKVNAARERLARVPAILRRFRQSVLAAACSGQLTADWRDEHAEREVSDAALERMLQSRKKYWSGTRVYNEPRGPQLRHADTSPPLALRFIRSTDFRTTCQRAICC